MCKNNRNAFCFYEIYTIKYFRLCTIFNFQTRSSSVQTISNETFGSSIISRYSNDVVCVFLGKETEISTSILGGGFHRVSLIYCLPGSNAQKYAREHSIAMKPLSELNLDEI